MNGPEDDFSQSVDRSGHPGGLPLVFRAKLSKKYLQINPVSAVNESITQGLQIYFKQIG